MVVLTKQAVSSTSLNQVLESLLPQYYLTHEKPKAPPFTGENQLFKDETQPEPLLKLREREKNGRRLVTSAGHQKSS